MSYEDGWAALNLEMPKRVPRVEFSAHDYHWQLVRTVVGIDVTVDSPDDVKSRASSAFVKAWNYDLNFAALIGNKEFGELQTHMGHAEFAEHGADYDNELSCPFQTPEQVLRFDPWEAYGPKDKQELVRRFDEHYQAQCAKYPTCVNMTGIYPSLITGLTYIFGWDMLLLAAGTDMERFGQLTNRYASWMQQYYDALAESSAPVVYTHDDMVWTNGAIFRPAWYRKYVFPNIKKYYAPLRDAGKKIIFVCDGNYTAFMDDIAACGNTCFWFEIFTDLEAIAERYGKTHAMIGNADTRILLSNDKAAIRAEVERCMKIGKQYPGYFMAVSNHIPPNTPVDAALYYNQVYEELCRR